MNAWSLTMREERGLRVFENRVLRRIFGPERGRLQGSGENYTVRSFIICSAHQWAGHVARMGEERGVYRILVGKLERKRSMGKN